MDKYLGKRLDGRYEMRELIGVGGMAYVYKAYDNIDDRTVAVKILRDEFLTNEEFTRRFRNESKAIAILNHPNIVKVLDVGFGQHLQYIVMEYIDGITLKEYLDQRKDIRWKEAVHFTVQILRALQHAHDKGIVHRDIKPQNIMLLSDGTIKVTDFGIARLSRSEMRATMEGDKAIGSVHYISPEQARGEITDEKADLYSVGVVLYEMLTGRLPFEADNAVSVAIMQMQSEPTLPHLINEDVPEGLEQITIKAMQKDAEKRYQSAAEMLSDIDEFKRNPSIKFAYTYFVDETPTRYVDAITRVRGEEETSEKDSSKDVSKKRKTSTVAILAAVTAAIVLVTVVGVFAIIGWINERGSKADIVVPSFIGMNYNNEVLKREDIGNYTIKFERAYNSEQQDGYVFRQEPAAGTTIKVHGTVTLYISRGSKKVTVPDITSGESVDAVERRLTNKGFVVEQVLESSAEVAENMVIRLDPESGTQAESGSKIKMFVSSGMSEEDQIPMSNVKGMSKEDAIAQLVKDGFDQTKITIEEVNNQSDNTVRKDVVVGVTPNSAEKQYPDVNIKLQVSTGFCDVPIDLKLPNTDTTVDLQFYVNGILNEELTSKYSSIMPKDIGTLRFVTAVHKQSYKVTVKISVADKANFTTYAEYNVNGKSGTYSITSKGTFTDPTTTTTTLPTTTTTTTTSFVDASATTGTTQAADTTAAANTTTVVTPPTADANANPNATTTMAGA